MQSNEGQSSSFSDKLKIPGVKKACYHLLFLCVLHVVLLCVYLSVSSWWFSVMNIWQTQHDHTQLYQHRNVMHLLQQDTCGGCSHKPAVLNCSHVFHLSSSTDAQLTKSTVEDTLNEMNDKREGWIGWLLHDTLRCHKATTLCHFSVQAMMEPGQNWISNSLWWLYSMSLLATLIRAPLQAKQKLSELMNTKIECTPPTPSQDMYSYEEVLRRNQLPYVSDSFLTPSSYVKDDDQYGLHKRL